MSLLELSGLIVAAYLAAGRTGSIATCLVLGITPLETLVIVLLMDMVQMPVYGFLLEASHRHIPLPERLRMWVKHRAQKIRERMEGKRYLKRLARYQPLAVIAVSTIPFRGFGVFSACILAFMLGYGRFTAASLIISGSFIGSLLSILIFFFPARWFNAL